MIAARSRSVVVVLALASCLGTAHAQGGGAGGAGGAGAGGQGGAGGAAGAAQGQAPSMTAALVNLQMELHALNSMNDAGGQQLDNVKKRISLMNSFIASKNLNDALATFRTTWKPSAVPLSFQQAYSTALDAEHLRGGVIPSTNDVDALATEVSATSTMVHERWNTLNKQLRESQLLTSFLDGKKLMDEYHDYAQKNAASLQAAEDAKAANQATLEKERDAKDNARRQAALTYLQKQWDARSHKASSGIDYDYGFSQGASQAGPFSQTPGSAYSAGTGSTPPTYAPVPVPTAYDYWTGTYFNSYADPYYDVNGYPQGYALEPNAPAGAAYRRAPDSNSPYHPTPAR